LQSVPAQIGVTIAASHPYRTNDLC
jgi:hypothetical protein